MLTSTQKEMFDLLRNNIHETGMDTADVQGAGGPQIGDTLRVLLPLTDEAHPVCLDMMVASLGDGADIVQFYTTLTFEASENRDELEKAIRSFNFFCPLGSFGIFREEQLYHKYCMLLHEDADPDKLCADTLDALSVLYQVLDNYYPIAMRFAQGKTTFAQAIEQGELAEP